MIFGACFRIQIPGHAQPLPDFANLLVIACHKFAWGDAFTFGINEKSPDKSLYLFLYLRQSVGPTGNGNLKRIAP